MPIGGVVVTTKIDGIKDVLLELAKLEEVDVHGHDDSGNIVAVLETTTSKEMESLVEKVNKIEEVLSVGLTYLNVEDEVRQDSTVNSGNLAE